jgi:riboflavin transporter FmnP
MIAASTAIKTRALVMNLFLSVPLFSQAFAAESHSAGALAHLFVHDEVSFSAM